MQTTTAPKAGNAPDLLQGILSVQVRNEDKITEQGKCLLPDAAKPALQDTRPD